MKSKPLVSVVIPTFNSERYLNQCLQSIRSQSYPNIEIIIVDNHSSDRTQEISENFDAKLLSMKSERAQAKNLGVEICKGQYLLFLDSDMELESTVVEECVKIAKGNARVGGIIIRERSVGNSFLARVRDFERSFYSKTNIESARFFRKDLVLRAGGFDKGAVFFEESVLPQKIELLGFNTRERIKPCILHHEENISLGEFLRKRYYYSKTARSYLKQYKRYGFNQVNIISRMQLFLSKQEFYEQPKLAIGVLILKGSEFVVWIAAFLFSYLG
jgi:glycosyltransferase involved in cell wall biosynthesis